MSAETLFAISNVSYINFLDITYCIKSKRMYLCDSNLQEGTDGAGWRTPSGHWSRSDGNRSGKHPTL